MPLHLAQHTLVHPSLGLWQSGVLFKERWVLMGGLGEVCATDSGAGRSMSRIVSLYKSLSDTSAWPSAPTHFTHTSHTHTHALDSWMALTVGHV